MKRIVGASLTSLCILFDVTPVVGYTNKDLKAARGVAAVVSSTGFLHGAIASHLKDKGCEDPFIVHLRNIGSTAHVTNGVLNGALEQNDFLYNIRRSVESVKRDGGRKCILPGLLAFARELSKDCVSRKLNKTWSADQARLARRGVRLGVDVAVDGFWMLLLCLFRQTDKTLREAFWNHFLVEFGQDVFNECAGEVLQRYAQDTTNPDIAFLRKIEQIIKGETELPSFADLFASFSTQDASPLESEVKK